MPCAAHPELDHERLDVCRAALPFLPAALSLVRRRGSWAALRAEVGFERWLVGLSEEPPRESAVPEPIQKREE